MRTVSIVGARPQFIKLAPVSRAMSEYARGEIDDIIIHTGQHYDDEMSRIFFDELRIPRPAEDLAVGSGSHGEQTAKMLESIEKSITAYRPDLVITYGDTNSTVAGALAAAKLCVPLAHIEAGLRSFNRAMPEEVNRIVADHVSDLLFAPTSTAVANLEKENLGERTHLVGDVMLDAVYFNEKLAASRSSTRSASGLDGCRYAVATLHRASNTDAKNLRGLLDTLNDVADRSLTIVFPMHPRTRASINSACPAWKPAPRLRIVDPIGYLEMLDLLSGATMALTDSGGLQKEAFFLGTPCITLRDETEWTETLDAGANRLVGSDRDALLTEVEWRLENQMDRTGIRARAAEMFGSGKAAQNIVREILQFLSR